MVDFLCNSIVVYTFVELSLGSIYWFGFYFCQDLWMIVYLNPLILDVEDGESFIIAGIIETSLIWSCIDLHVGDIIDHVLIQRKIKFWIRLKCISQERRTQILIIILANYVFLIPNLLIIYPILCDFGLFVLRWTTSLFFVFWQFFKFFNFYFHI